jgi:twitching motility two-component system response regulator PilG
MTNVLAMQANSNTPAQFRASPAKIMQEVVTRKLSGQLTISDYAKEGVSWQIYVGKGNFHFACSNHRKKERLSYLLRKFQPDLEILAWENSNSDYDYLCSYWRAEKLSLQDVRKLLFVTMREALVQVLAIAHAEIQIQEEIGLDPILLSIGAKEIIQPVRAAIGQWAQIRSSIPSLFHQLFLPSSKKLALAFNLRTENKEIIEPLTKLLEKNLCLYQLASELNMDALLLANLLKPQVEQGIVTVTSFEDGGNSDRASEAQKNRPVVACIDDSQTVHRQVKLTLEAAGYEVLSLTEPARALTALARKPPELVLMDINMPDIDGYELCRLLRQSSLLQNIPIVMLTGRDGIVDRLRARVAGATDYMTKPIHAQNLIELVNKLLNRTEV